MGGLGTVLCGATNPPHKLVFSIQHAFSLKTVVQFTAGKIKFFPAVKIHGKPLDHITSHRQI